MTTIELLINVFNIPSWVKRFFVVKFPRINIQHEGSHIIRQTLNASAFKLKATVVLHQNYFQLSIVKHNNLEFYSFFDYQNHEDILYHLHFALQQKEMTNEEGFLELIDGAGSTKKTTEDLKSAIQRITEFKKMEIITPSNFVAKSQFLCV